MIKPDYDCLGFSDSVKLPVMIDGLMKVVTIMQDNFNMNITFMQNINKTE